MSCSLIPAELLYVGEEDRKTTAFGMSAPLSISRLTMRGSRNLPKVSLIRSSSELLDHPIERQSEFADLVATSDQHRNCVLARFTVRVLASNCRVHQLANDLPSSSAHALVDPLDGGRDSPTLFDLIEESPASFGATKVWAKADRLPAVGSGRNV